MNSGKVIFVNRFYKPDFSATAQILSDLCEFLATQNSNAHNVVVVTSRLLYDNTDTHLSSREIINGVTVHRVWTSSFGRKFLKGRAIDYLTFYIASFFVLMKVVARGDKVIAKTDPPLISAVAALVCRLKNAELYNWVQDLFPEVAEALGMSAFKGTTSKFLKLIRNRSLRIARKNIVLGDIMADRVASQGVARNKIEVIHNWKIGSSELPLQKKSNPLAKEWNLDDMFVVGYSGNLGRAHEFKALLYAMDSLKDYQNIRFLFIGGGAGMTELQKHAEQHSLGNVIFKPYQPIESLNYSLSVPDVHLISLQPSLEGLVVPSKFYGILSVHRPMLFLGDPNGEIATLIHENSCGTTINPADFDQLTSRILDLYFDQQKLEQYTNNAKALHETRFADGISRKSWNQLLSV